MERDGDEVHLNTEEARGGTTSHGVRYVLAIGLFLAIGALSAIWITGALDQSSSSEPKQAVTAEESALGGR